MSYWSEIIFVEYAISITTIGVIYATVHCGIMFIIYTAGHQDRQSICCSLCQSKQYLYILSRSDRALVTVVLCSLYIRLDTKIDNLAVVHCIRIQYLYLLSRSDRALFTVVLCSLSIRLDTKIDNLAVVNCVRVCSIYTYCRGQIGHCSLWYYVHYI